MQPETAPATTYSTASPDSERNEQAKEYDEKEEDPEEVWERGVVVAEERGEVVAEKLGEVVEDRAQAAEKPEVVWERAVMAEERDLKPEDVWEREVIAVEREGVKVRVEVDKERPRVDIIPNDSIGEDVQQFHRFNFKICCRCVSQIAIHRARRFLCFKIHT